MTRHGERCETCCYWSTKGIGSCHRRAPGLMEAPAGVFPNERAAWPPTALDDWCGEWQAQHEFIAATRPA